MLYWLLHEQYDVQGISFDYGQRHRRELGSAKQLCDVLGVPHEVVDVRNFRSLLGGSALTDDSVAVPHGHYESETMKATVVPNRNAIMLSVAWGAAVARGLDAVGVGIHAGDHAIYPDCRPEFASTFERALRYATDRPEMHLLRPFVNLTKTDICAIGGRLGVRYDLTWTCYEGGLVHCGKCGACQERKEAFADSGVPDPTIYANAA